MRDYCYAWNPSWRLSWQRFRYWRARIGFESAYYKIRWEAPND